MKNQFITALAPIYFVVFVLMAQFVLVNVVVAVLMKKLDVNKRKNFTKKIIISFLKESNRMMADDAEIDEEIERQLEADAHDRNYLEQPLLDDKELDVSDLTFHLCLLSKTNDHHFIALGNRYNFNRFARNLLVKCFLSIL